MAEGSSSGFSSSCGADASSSQPSETFRPRLIRSNSISFGAKDTVSDSVDDWEGFSLQRASLRKRRHERDGGDSVRRMLMLKSMLISERKQRILQSEVVEQLTEKLDDAVTQLKTKQKELEVLIRNRLELKEKLSSLEEKLQSQSFLAVDSHGKTAVKGKRRQNEAELARLSSQLEDQSKTVEELRDELRAKAQLLDDSRESARTNLERAQDAVESLKKQLDEKDISLRAVDDERRRLTQQNSDQSLAIQIAKMRVEETEKSTSEREKLLADSLSRIRSLEAEVLGKKESCDTMATTLLGLKTKLANTQMQLRRFPLKKIHRILPPCDAQLMIQKNPLSGALTVVVAAYRRQHVYDAIHVSDAVVDSKMQRCTLQYDNKEPDVFEGSDVEEVREALLQFKVLPPPPD